MSNPSRPGPGKAEGQATGVADLSGSRPITPKGITMERVDDAKFPLTVNQYISIFRSPKNKEELP